MQLTKGKQERPRRILIYGENGVGKSQIASQFPTPVFINLEDGLGDIDCVSTPVLRTLSEVHEALFKLESTDFATIVTDTADWLEKLICNDVAAKAGKKTIEDIGFGRGWQGVEKEWKSLLDHYSQLWKQGRHIVFTCHERVAKFANPEGDSYNYYRPALDEKGSGLVTEWCDEVLFARYKTYTKTQEEGFKQSRAIAVGGRERVLVCNKQAAIEAKNRLGLPDEVPLSIESFYGVLKKFDVKPSGETQPQAKPKTEVVVTEETPF